MSQDDTLSWASRKAAAADLAALLGRPITVATLSKRWLLDPECPLPKGRGSIPREPLLIYARRKFGIPSPGAFPVNPERQVRTQLLQRKLAVLDREMIPLADVRTGITGAMAELRRALLDELPISLAMDIRGKQPEEAAEIVREALRQALNTFHQAAQPA